MTESLGPVALVTDLSATSIAAYAAGGSLLIGAVFAGIVSVIQAWRTIAQKVTAIEGHVNSEKTAAEGRERAKDMEIALLREMLTDRKLTAALLAQAASHPPIVPTASPVLDQIEANTAATADGVQHLKAS